MIDTDKMRAAYAATPLCQNAWTKRDGDASDPTKLCAVSAMVSYAGVQPDLIYKMDVAFPNGGWVRILAVPVMRAEYGVPEEIVNEIVRTFDRSENEWRGVQEVLALCERHNMDERHDEALVENDVRFPQHTCAEPTLSITFASLYGATSWSSNPAYAGIDFAAWAKVGTFQTIPASAPSSHKTPTHSAKGQSKFWTPQVKPKSVKLLTV